MEPCTSLLGCRSRESAQQQRHQQPPSQWFGGIELSNLCCQHSVRALMLRHVVAAVAGHAPVCRCTCVDPLQQAPGGAPITHKVPQELCRNSSVKCTSVRKQQDTHNALKHCALVAKKI